MLWDIFCAVVDNYGDAGVCWRLARGLAQHGQHVRLWIDDLQLVQRLSPDGFGAVTVAPWPATRAQYDVPGQVVIEAFGCALPEPVLMALGHSLHSDAARPVWLNLEYLSAEPYAERNHLLPSPVLSGPARGLEKVFFYPGFTARTGGLLREPDFASLMPAGGRADWLARYAPGVPHRAAEAETWISLFCYEPVALPALLTELGRRAQPVRVWVTAGRASTAIAQLRSSVSTAEQQQWPLLSTLPFVPQNEYDQLLHLCDLNFVRGEDSWIRAIWATRPFVWQPYIQDDGAHFDKLHAFLELASASTVVRNAHAWWNGMHTEVPDFDALLRDAFATKLCARQAQQADLVTQLLAFARQKTG